MTDDSLRDAVANIASRMERSGVFEAEVWAKRLREALGEPAGEPANAPEGTIVWFGRNWGAPICASARHVATPVRSSCVECERKIRAGDDGVMTPALPDGAYVPHHLDCWLTLIGVQVTKEVVGS